MSDAEGTLAEPAGEPAPEAAGKGTPTRRPRFRAGSSGKPAEPVGPEKPTRAQVKAAKAEQKAEQAAARSAHQAARAAGRAAKKSMPRAERRAVRRVQKEERKQIRQDLKAQEPVTPLNLLAQLRGVIRCGHPRQAVVLAVAAAVIAQRSDRPAREVAVAAAAVLVVQMLLGMTNDFADQRWDRVSGAPGKPIVEGVVPAGNVSYAMAALMLVVIPLSLQNGRAAGLALLATVVVGWVHNLWLHRSWLSWLGWVLTFGLLTVFLSYGGWAGSAPRTPPSIAFAGAAMALGLCMHLITSLPDLTYDNASGSKSLPLRIALKTGAPRLMLLTGAITLLSLAGLVVAGLTVGLRQ